MAEPELNAEQPVPTPCAQCGGTARVELAADAGARGQVARLVCPYCGQVEPLPALHEARVRTLTDRLVRLARAREDREAALLRYAALWQRLTMPDGQRSLLACGATLVAVAFSTLRGVSHALAAPAELRESLLSNAVWGPSFVFAAVLASLTSYALGRRQYLREVAPLLSPRPPLSPGAPLRCRMCGGPLDTPREAAFWRCGYCQSTHLLPDAHAREHLTQVGAELTALQHGLAGADRAMERALAPGRQVAIFWTLSFVTAAACSVGASRLLLH